MNRKKIIITIGLLIIIVLGFLVITRIITNYTGYSIVSFITGKVTGKNTASIDDFAKCVGEKTKMYGAFWCGHCQNQKKMFGSAFQYVDYIECDPRGENSQTDLCLAVGIQGYPSWEINNKLYPGEMSLEKLAELSGCELNK